MNCTNCYQNDIRSRRHGVLGRQFVTILDRVVLVVSDGSVVVSTSAAAVVVTKLCEHTQF